MAPRKDYRPTNDDFRPSNTKQLSCKEAGKHDWETWGKAAAKKKAEEATRDISGS